MEEVVTVAVVEVEVTMEEVVDMVEVAMVDVAGETEDLVVRVEAHGLVTTVDVPVMLQGIVAREMEVAGVEAEVVTVAGMKFPAFVHDLFHLSKTKSRFFSIGITDH